MATSVSPLAPVVAPSFLMAPLRAVLWFADELARAQRTTFTYERLAAQSDDALARQGLRREDLPSIAFRSHFED